MFSLAVPSSPNLVCIFCACVECEDEDRREVSLKLGADRLDVSIAAAYLFNSGRASASWIPCRRRPNYSLFSSFFLSLLAAL